MESTDPDTDPDPAPSPVEEVKPPSSRSADISLIIVVVLLGIAGLFFAVRGVFNLIIPDRPSALRQVEPPRVVERLIRQTGRGDRISEEFDVPTGCRKPILSFDGSAIDEDIDVAWVGFRIYDRDIADHGIDHSGPHDLLDSPQGSTRLTLPAESTYYVETTSFNAIWHFQIDCE